MDVIISNCVINLSADKDQVLKEAFRVFKPAAGSRSPILLSAARCRSRYARKCCCGQAVSRARFRTRNTKQVATAGFEDVGIEPTRIYTGGDARDSLSGEGISVDRIAPDIDGKFMSAFVRARKP